MFRRVDRRIFSCGDARGANSLAAIGANAICAHVAAELGRGISDVSHILMNA
jgi:hypothetical protein